MLERLKAAASAFARAPERKASAAGPLIALHMTGRARWTPRDYAGLAREGFARNPVAYRCVRMIAEAAASVPLLLYQGREELSQHPLLNLLTRPNPMQTGAEFFEAAYASLQVAGNAYIEAVSLEGQPRELYVLRADRVRAEPGPQGWADAYIYAVPGREMRLARDAAGHMPVMHLKLFHPLDDHYGFSPLEAAAQAIDAHNSATSWNKALIDNAARPSGALVYRSGEDARLSDEQFARLKRELEDGYGGPAAAGRPLLLEGGLEWRPMSLTPHDLDFAEGKTQAARDIAMAFGIPPMLLGVPGDATYANYAAANLAFWRQTVLPLATRLAQALTHFLGPRFGPDLRFAIDADAVDALNAEREALWRRLEAARFLTDDEKREAAGYGPL